MAELYLRLDDGEELHAATVHKPQDVVQALRELANEIQRTAGYWSSKDAPAEEYTPDFYAPSPAWTSSRV